MQPYPELDRRTLVSIGGGVEPLWSPTGAELFYHTGLFASRMMAVPVRTQAGFEAGEPQLLFAFAPGLYSFEPISAHPLYDVSRDGQRFLMTKSLGPFPRYTRINVVVNWFEELKARVPSGLVFP